MRRFVLLTGLMAALFVTAQTNDKVLMTIDGKPIYQSEFDYIYGKNNNGDVLEKKTPEEYLDLFINFKLKVKEAEDQGLDTLSSFKKELRGYCMQLAKPYMTDTVKREELLQLAYQRRMKDIKVAHIAVKCPSKTDTTEAYAKIQEALKRATGYKEGKKTIKPEDFAMLADSLSDDPSVADNHGTIGWLSVFRTVYNFENAAYETPVGKVSGIFRTPFGYHILKVLEERKSPGEYHAAHIMLFTQRGDEAQNAVVKQKIDSLYKLLQAGADFEEMAKANSQDRGTSVRGGDLNWVSTGALVPEFEEALFSMKKEGEISQPIRSMYGWHIIKLIEKRSWGSYEELKPNLERLMSRDSRAEIVEKSFEQSLKDKYGADKSREALEDEFMADLAKQDENFGNLQKEYHDGILLFDISNREVWEKAAQDDAGLTKYFEEHKNQYNWDKLHYNGYVVYCRNEATQKAAYQIAKHALPDSLTSYLNRRLNDSIQYVKVQHVMCEKGDSAQLGNKLVQSVLFAKNAKPKVVCLKAQNTEAGLYPQADYPFVVFAGDVMDQPETYMDVRGPVTSDYQDYLEEQWVQELRKKHNVVIVK